MNSKIKKQKLKDLTEFSQKHWLYGNNEIKEYITILKNNGKDNPFENRILRKIIKVSKQLLAEQAKNKKLVEVIDNAIKICNNNIGFACVDNGICGLNALEKVQQALNEVNNEQQRNNKSNN